MMVAPQRGKDPPEGGCERDRSDPWAIEPIPKGLMDKPIEFIFAEHHRQREAAAIMVVAADGGFNKRGVADLIAFLEEDFARHIGDEEIVLFPILRQRCLPEDNIDRIIDRLQDEHRTDESDGDAVIGILKQRLEGRPLSASSSARLRRFAEHIRQHLALENNVLLPIARVRLDEEMLGILAAMLRERRARR